MGIKLIFLLGLLIGVLYSLHILANDYQAITAPKLLRLLFKRDINSTSSYYPTVRWKKILKHDPVQCARYLYCDLGARLPNNQLRNGLIYMLSLKLKEEDKIAFKEFESAYSHGRSYRSFPEQCNKIYPMCPFNTPLLLDLINYLLKKTLKLKEEDKIAFKEFESAYSHGRSYRSFPEQCNKIYPMCPFNTPLLLDLINYLLKKT